MFYRFLKPSFFWIDGYRFRELRWYEFKHLEFIYNDLDLMKQIVYYSMELNNTIPIDKLDFIHHDKLREYADIIVDKTTQLVEDIDKFIVDNKTELLFIARSHIEGYNKFFEEDMSFRTYTLYIKLMEIISDENEKEANKNDPKNQPKKVGKHENAREKLKDIKRMV